ncbi:hypothetical protein ACLOJK_005190 [Asimina triloba]
MHLMLANLGREGWEADLGRAAVYRRGSGQGSRFWPSGQGCKSEPIEEVDGGFGQGCKSGQRRMRSKWGELEKKDAGRRRRWLERAGGLGRRTGEEKRRGLRGGGRLVAGGGGRAGKMHERGEEKGTWGRREAGRWRGREGWEDVQERRIEGDSGAAGGWSLEGAGGLGRPHGRGKEKGTMAASCLETMVGREDGRGLA